MAHWGATHSGSCVLECLRYATQLAQIIQSPLVPCHHSNQGRFLKYSISYFEEWVSEFMWDHQLFYEAKLEANPRGKNFCLYNLPYWWFIFVFAVPLSQCQVANYLTQVLLDRELLLFFSRKVWWDLSRFPRERGWALGLIQNAVPLMACSFKPDILQEPSPIWWPSRNLAKVVVLHKLFLLLLNSFFWFSNHSCNINLSYLHDLYYVCDLLMLT